jgi:hypothetical protein
MPNEQSTESSAPALDQTSVDGVITAFINDVIASAPARDEEGLAAARALSRLPRSEQRRLGDSETFSLHEGLLDFLQIDDVPDGPPMVQILEEDPLTKQAKAQITFSVGSHDEIRIVELERTICLGSRRLPLAGNNVRSAADSCKADNLTLYGDEEPWKIGAMEIP